MSDTPRTEAEHARINADNESSVVESLLQALDFARGLERELAELLADKARLDFLDSQVWPHQPQPDYTPPIVQLVVKALHNPHGEWVNVAQSGRAALDAAMRSSQPQPK